VDTQSIHNYFPKAEFSIGFCKLVSEVYKLVPKDAPINKNLQAADWRLRPLPAEYKSYAQSDSYYLFLVWQQIKKDIAKKSFDISMSTISYVTRMDMAKVFPSLQFNSIIDWHNAKIENKTEIDRDLFTKISEFRIMRAKREDEHPTCLITGTQIAKLVLSCSQSDKIPNRETIMHFFPKNTRLDTQDAARILLFVNAARERSGKSIKPINTMPTKSQRTVTMVPIPKPKPSPSHRAQVHLITDGVTEDEETSPPPIPHKVAKNTMPEDFDPPPRSVPFILPEDAHSIRRIVRQVVPQNPKSNPTSEDHMDQDDGDDDEDILDLHAPEGMQLDPVVPPSHVPIPDPAPVPVPARPDNRWCTHCSKAGHTNALCWKLKPKGERKDHFHRNPAMKTRRNQIQNKNQNARRKAAFLRQQIQLNQVQHENLQLKLRLLQRK